MLEQIEKTMYNVAIYIRLSKEDVDRGYDESESIKNQRTLLTEYVQKLGWEYKLIDIYIDQGYTGTNFNRPAFQRMIRDINSGKVNMVVTKDLSRLGRDYIETGEYIEKWFQENNVRYVSVTDGIDTFETANGNNDIAPFKSILNDMYSKDLSKKIRTALHTMQKQGKWVGGKTAIGYMKDPNDKNKLIICEPEAEIVKTIFNMALAGNQVGVIRDFLNTNNIPTANQSRYNKDSFWENKTISGIRDVHICNTLLYALKNYKKKQSEYKKTFKNQYKTYHKEEVKNEYGKVVEYRIVEDKGNVISLNNMNLVFVKNNGVYVGTDITRYPFKIIHDELNIKKCRFYDLRGSYATKILNSGVEIRDVADMLGHKNIETTENYYITSLDENRNKASKKFDKIINSDIINMIASYK